MLRLLLGMEEGRGEEAREEPPAPMVRSMARVLALLTDTRASRHSRRGECSRVFIRLAFRFALTAASGLEAFSKHHLHRHLMHAAVATVLRSQAKIGRGGITEGEREDWEAARDDAGATLRRVLAKGEQGGKERGKGGKRYVEVFSVHVQTRRCTRSSPA